MNNWKPWVRSKGRPVTGLVDVRYLDGKEFLRKLAQDCYWGADSLIEFWREAQENAPGTPKHQPKKTRGDPLESGAFAPPDRAGRKWTSCWAQSPN